MPTVQCSTRFNVSEFIQEIKKEVNDSIDVLVAVIPSYHHLKKAIFELRKDNSFTSNFDIKFVVTKVNALNFFSSPNRTLYNYLIENCIKGVCNAVIFETSQSVPREELQLM
jgi:hypothetical protein